MTRMLERLPRAAALLIIEHDMDVVASLADRVTVLHHGEVLTEGTFDEVKPRPAGVRGLPGGGVTGLAAGGVGAHVLRREPRAPRRLARASPRARRWRSSAGTAPARPR